MTWLKWRTLWRSQSSIKELCLPDTMLNLNGILKNCSTCCVANLERIAGFYEIRFGDPRPAFKGLFLTGHERYYHLHHDEFQFRQELGNWCVIVTWCGELGLNYFIPLSDRSIFRWSRFLNTCKVLTHA